MNEPVKQRLKQPDITCSVDKEDLRKLASLLEEHAKAAAELEIPHFTPAADDEDDLRRRQDALRQAFDLTVAVSGTDGRELVGTVSQVFDSPNFPERVKTFYLASDVTLRALNYQPRNAFRLYLDFERPAVFDFRVLPGLPTPNGSNLEVEGYDSPWANGVFNEITRFFEGRKAKLPIVHRHTVYDLLLYSVGIPFAFWVCQRSSGFVNSLGSGNAFLQSAVYVYLFAASIILFRVLYHYLRWVAPIVEYRSPRSGLGGHRAVLAALALGVFGSFVYDVVKWLLGFA